MRRSLRLPRLTACSCCDSTPKRLRGDRTYYVTPFVTDGGRLFVFDEPGDRSDALEELLVGNRTTISSASTGELDHRCHRSLPDVGGGGMGA